MKKQPTNDNKVEKVNWVEVILVALAFCVLSYFEAPILSEEEEET